MAGVDTDFDPSRLALGQEQAPTRRRPRRKRSRFVIVPAMWIEQLAIIQAHASAYRVALYLLYESWQTRSTTLKLTNVPWPRLGLGGRGRRAPCVSCGRPD